MIKLNTKQRTVRECRAPFEYQTDAGELVTEEVRVRYFSPTVQQSKQLYEELEQTLESKAQFWQSSQLAVLLAGLPDIETENGTFEPVPPKPDEESGKAWDEYQTARRKAERWLEAIEVKNLTAIRKAMEDDIDPKSQGGK